MTKLRKVLSHFGVVNDLEINLPKLLEELRNKDLFSEDWTAASSESDNLENLFIKSNQACKINFNGNDNIGYTEVNLSKPAFSSTELSENDIYREKSMIYRLKRLDSSRAEYSEHADETVHCIEDRYFTDELRKIFLFFKGKPCRVRIAKLLAGKKINPHIDYDPSYIFRYHIPLITQKECLFYIVDSKGTYFYHMPANGKMYWLNTGVKHGVENNGLYDRYHLLIDVTGNYEKDNIPNISFFNGDEVIVDTFN